LDFVCRVYRAAWRFYQVVLNLRLNLLPSNVFFGGGGGKFTQKRSFDKADLKAANLKRRYKSPRKFTQRSGKALKSAANQEGKI
jgi:hypothetical protein